MLRRRGLDLAGHAVETFVQQGAQRPAGAVAGEHVQVVDVDVALAVGAPGLGRIDVVEPVVGHHLARHVQDQAAQGIALVGVGVDAPVAPLQVFVDRAFDVDRGAAVFAQAPVLLAVGDVGARGAVVACFDQSQFDAVLDALDVGHAARGQRGEVSEHALGHRIERGALEFAGGGARALHRVHDLGGVERDQFAFTLADALRQTGHFEQGGIERRLGHRFIPLLLRATIQDTVGSPKFSPTYSGPQRPRGRRREFFWIM